MRFFFKKWGSFTKNFSIFKKFYKNVEISYLYGVSTMTENFPITDTIYLMNLSNDVENCKKFLKLRRN